MLWMGIWLHGYTVIPVQMGGSNLEKIWVWANQNDVAMSWLRLQEASACIPHPYHMYINFFSTLDVLLMGIWVDPYTVIPVCRWGVEFANIGVWVWVNRNDVAVSCLRL